METITLEIPDEVARMLRRSGSLHWHTHSLAERGRKVLDLIERIEADRGGYGFEAAEASDSELAAVARFFQEIGSWVSNFSRPGELLVTEAEKSRRKERASRSHASRKARKGLPTMRPIECEARPLQPARAPLPSNVVRLSDHRTERTAP